MKNFIDYKDYKIDTILHNPSVGNEYAEFTKNGLIIFITGNILQEFNIYLKIGDKVRIYRDAYNNPVKIEKK